MAETESPYRRPEFFAALAVGVFLLFLMPWHRMLIGQNDFVHFYIGGVLSGSAELHSAEANFALQKQLAGGVFAHSYFVRPTFYGSLLKPLAWLPYQVAYVVFQMISVACFCMFVRLNLRSLPQLPVLCAMSLPMLSCFFNGQDVMFLLLFCSVSLWLAGQKRDLEAGMILALCAIKAHLFLLAPFAMLLHKRYRIFYGGVIGCLILFAIGVADSGWASQKKLLELLMNPASSPYPEIMPNLRSLLGENHGLFFAVFPIVAGICIRVMQKAPSYESAFGWSLLGGLLLSFHAYTHDALLLLPTLAAIAPSATRQQRIALTAITLPFFYVLSLLGPPFSAALPLGMILCVALALFGTSEAEIKPVLAASA